MVPTRMIPYPDVSNLPDELARAVCRMVRLVNEMRRRHPDLDMLAISTETELDHRAAGLVAAWVESQGGELRLMISPWDGRRFIEGDGPFGPLALEPDGRPA